ncbi:MAG: hypothetical protein AVDCRST_MAG77-3182 [uncultured Chloroflexi bacterium]|uniref:Sporulation stage II protein D amidase enhancer LytB N-terminal domain-containing protein n=1 Tax=uncultured Chloroflexota bacterium TaxID=166587 RepID=A0A6J4J6W3_9CHLR|nr:MAG: hypothetical protein AVDCRST_MAG77-3182 [uncultured Chloroflexota bacterium]
MEHGPLIPLFVNTLRGAAAGPLIGLILAVGAAPALAAPPAAAALLSSPFEQAAPAAAAVYQFPDPNQALVFEGQGWGHGVGLCQWGARGRALAGQSAEQIVAAYYAGTTVQTAVAPETTIRVLVHSGLQLDASETGKVTGKGGAWQLAAAGTPAIQAPAGATLELSAEGNLWRYQVKAPDGAIAGAGTVAAPIVLRPLDGNTRFVVGYKPAAAVPGRQGEYYDAYRGELVLALRGGGLETVNRLSLEDYLRGVVPAEVPASWPAEAVKAQTLAARSYAVWQARNRSAERYDVDDTTAYQVYRGANAEHPGSNAAIDATAGQAILHGAQTVQGFFFSTCAGWTENNEVVWPGGQPLPYLRGIRDVDAAGRPYDADSPRSTWSTGALTVAQLEVLLNGHEATEIGKLLSLDLTRRSPSGRLLEVVVTGTAGVKTLRSDTLMVRFNRGRPEGVAQLLSTNFDLKWAPTEALVLSQGGVPATPTAGPPPPTRTALPGGQSTPSGQGTPGTPGTPGAVRSPTAMPGTGAAPQGTPRPASTPVPPTATPVPTPVYRLELTQPAPARPSGPSNAYFAETGHNVGGAFLAFFQRAGGLDVFGYPRTEELLEDGRTVQFFQRARLEFHVDKAGTLYEVQAALLGDTVTTSRRPFPTTTPFDPSADHHYFPETAHGLHHGFLSFWRNRGGLDAFGYPISEELVEGGYTVQYFQRARFEYHPEHAGTPYEVQLGLLGDQLLQQRSWLR